MFCEPMTQDSAADTTVCLYIKTSDVGARKERTWSITSCFLLFSFEESSRNWKALTCTKES